MRGGHCGNQKVEAPRARTTSSRQDRSSEFSVRVGRRPVKGEGLKPGCDPRVPLCSSSCFERISSHCDPITQLGQSDGRDDRLDRQSDSVASVDNVDENRCVQKAPGMKVRRHGHPRRRRNDPRLPSVSQSPMVANRSALQRVHRKARIGADRSKVAGSRQPFHDESRRNCRRLPANP